MNKFFAISGYIVVCLLTAVMLVLFDVQELFNSFSDAKTGLSWTLVHTGAIVLSFSLLILPFRIKIGAGISLAAILLFSAVLVQSAFSFYNAKYDISELIQSCSIFLLFLLSILYLTRILINKKVSGKSRLTDKNILNILILVFPSFLHYMLWYQAIVDLINKGK